MSWKSYWSEVRENFKSDWNNSKFGKFFNNLGALVTDAIPSYIANLSGSGLTEQQKQMNQFNHEEAQLAFDREMAASNTAYQRQTADLQAAGINPLMAVSKGVSVPASSAASSVSPSSAANLSDLLSIMLIPLQKSQLKAQIANTNAQTRNIEEKTKSEEIYNRYRDESERLRVEGQKLSNDLSFEQRRKLSQDIDNAKQELRKLIAETKNEEDKNDLILAEIATQNATARRITELLPYEKALSSASTEQAKASASASLAQAAWQNGLIDRGMIEIAVQQAGYERDSAEYNSAIDRVRSQVSGDLPIEGVHPIVDRLVKSIGRAKYYITK